MGGPRHGCSHSRVVALCSLPSGCVGVAFSGLALGTLPSHRGTSRGAWGPASEGPPELEAGLPAGGAAQADLGNGEGRSRPVRPKDPHSLGGAFSQAVILSPLSNLTQTRTLSLALSWDSVSSSFGFCSFGT